jgi:hypothetical protein
VALDERLDLFAIKQQFERFAELADFLAHRQAGGYDAACEALDAIRDRAVRAR